MPKRPFAISPGDASGSILNFFSQERFQNWKRAIFSMGRILSPQRVAILLFIATVLFSFFYLTVALPQPLLERFGFRQTQTALSSYYMVKSGFRFDYWTPVLGQGWSIPFEFPIYQAIVAFIVKSTGMPLAATGRVVSWLFMLACCWPLYLTLRQFSVNMATRFFCLALFVGAPEYVFWSSTFMIETAALFFALFFAYYAARILIKEANFLDFVLGAFFLAAAILQKSTTALPIALLFCVLVSIIYFRPTKLKQNWRLLASSAVMILVAIGIGLEWTHYTDLIKAQNPIAKKLTSSSLSIWNFGSLDQRLSSQLWLDVLYDRVFRSNLFGGMGLAILGVGVVVAPDSRSRIAIIVALLAGLLPFLIFVNLHIIHDYYQVSATVFLLVGVGLAAAAIFEQLLPDRPLLQSAAMILMVVANFVSFEIHDAGYRRLVLTASNNNFLKISDFIRSHTAEDDTIVWYGLDWSSAAAFYSERKSLTIPPWHDYEIDADFETDAIVNTSKYLDQAPAAIVVCESPNKATILTALREKYATVPVQEVDNCSIFMIGGR